MVLDMNNNRNEWIELSNHISGKVQEIIEEMDCWKGEVFVWVNGNAAEVNLGTSADSYPGFKESVTEFTVKGHDNVLVPDYERIAEYAYSWFDFRS